MPAGVEVRREAWATAIPTLKTVYDRNPATRRGGLVRQKWWWQLRPLRDTGLQAAVAYRDGNASGYLIYKRADDEFSVDECFYDDAETAQVLVAFAFAHRNTVKTYIYRTPDAGWLGDLLPEPGALTSTTRAFGWCEC
ncbi:hypothetical protein [Lacticaseibacillus camelliae]|uniref:hypothetical protein n=1 Tax=Lacticaseibacillus camelliae TaxID=381742 RepID=UPI001CDAAC29|nr:hypothetical protein [Lacticaseibacillus camelliae]